MSESTAQANGHQPIERLVDRDLLARVNDLEIKVRAMDAPVTRAERIHDAVVWLSMLSLIVLAVLAIAGVIR